MKKKLNFIRWNGVIPLTIFSVMVVCYFIFFFDMTLKIIGEVVGTRINGPEVNIGSVKTNLRDGRLEVTKIEISDHKNLEFNKIEIGKVVFSFSWDALLRSKFVINEIKTEQIGVDVKRKRVAKWATKSEDNSKAKQIAKDIAKSGGELLSKEFEGDILGDIFKLANEKPSVVVKGITSQLSSLAFIKEIENDILEMELKWNKALKNLPKEKDLKNSYNELKGLKFKNTKDVINGIKKIERTKKMVDKDLKKIKHINKMFKGDLKHLKDTKSEIQELIEKDIATLEKKFKIPNIDTQTIAKSIFTKYILELIAPYKGYLDKIVKYLPPKYLPEGMRKKVDVKEDKTDKVIAGLSEMNAKKVLPPQRAEGKIYRFRKTERDYPLFLLKKADFSADKLNGNLRAITFEQDYLNMPATLLLAGDFREIKGISFDLISDHRTTNNEADKELLHLKVKEFPVGKKSFVKSSNFNFGFNKATSRISVNGILQGETQQIDILISLTKINYFVEAKNKQIKTLLDNVIKNTPQIIIEAKIENFSKPRISIKSNLAKNIKRSIKDLVDVNIRDAKRQIREAVLKEINGPKLQLESKMTKKVDEVKGKIGSAEKMTNSYKKKLTNKMKSAKKEQSNNAKKKLKKKSSKALKSLRKKLPFGL